MTAAPPPATITGVRGGIGGLAATYSALLLLAAVLEAAAGRLREWAGLNGRLLTDGDLLESALLSPGTFAVAEEAVSSATAGLVADSVGWELDADLVRGFVRLTEATDDAVRRGLDMVDGELDRALLAGLVATTPLWVGDAAAVWAGGMLCGADPPAVAQDLLVGHPGLVSALGNGAGGLLGAPDTEVGAAVLAAAYGSDGSAVVTPYPGSVTDGLTEPASLAGLIGHLEEVSELSEAHHSPANGTIEIQAVTSPEGQVSYIVYLPGADDMATLPWTQDGDVRDMSANLHLLAGEGNAYQDGILQAMHEAGIAPDDPVLLVGHSQGGMEAAAILSQGSPFDVTDVVTAGSPTAQLDGFPAGSHVTSLVHDGDLVPLLDGSTPDSVEQVVVQFDDGSGGGILEHHLLPHYVAGAAAADTSHDPSVAANLASLHDHGFLGDEAGTTVTSQLFQIVRDP